MNRRVVIHVISLLLGIVGISESAMALAALLLGDGLRTAAQMGLCALLAIAAAAAGFWLTRRRRGENQPQTRARDGFAGVGIGWLAATLAAALPFILIADLPLADALFEATSGLTTTGSSVLADGLATRSGTVLRGEVIEAMPRCLLLWRATMNWLGGIGIVFFVLLLLPLMKVAQGKMLYNAEVPGLKTDDSQLTPRLSTSVKLVLGVYCALTALCGALYWLLGMEAFDAVCHAFSTISTGGFSTHSASFAFFWERPLLQWCATLFMFLSACNFALFVRSVLERREVFHQDEEFRLFCYLFVIATLLSAALLWLRRTEGIPLLSGVQEPRGLESCLRAAAFQVATLMSTTGFCTSDYQVWGQPAILLLFALLMIPCGCGGSTAGGMKMGRVIVLVKQLRFELEHCLSPHALRNVRLNGERIEPALLNKTMAFALMYIVVLLVVAFLLTLLDGTDVATALGASISSLGNIGPGFGLVGPAGAFTAFSAPAKWLLSLEMIVGRLELYTLLVMFCPSFWWRRGA